MGLASILRTAVATIAVSMTVLSTPALATVVVTADGASVNGPEYTAPAKTPASPGHGRAAGATAVIGTEGATNLRKSATTLTVIGTEAAR